MLLSCRNGAALRPIMSFARSACRWWVAMSRHTRRHIKNMRVLYAGGRTLAAVDPAPRVILDPEFGMAVLGRSAEDASIAEDIYRHTIDIIMGRRKARGLEGAAGSRFLRCGVLGSGANQAGEAQSRGDRFWVKSRLVTGAASGIGKACVDSLLARGAAVVASGRCTRRQTVARPQELFWASNATSPTKSRSAPRSIRPCRRSAGSICWCLNAGIFPKSSPIAAMAADVWRRTPSINLDANLVLMRECHPPAQAAPREAGGW